MLDFRADLHCHSTCSDGTFSPEQLVRAAKEMGLSGLSITDHDSISAYDTALPLAKEVGLEMIVGVEFSSMHFEESVHILGYAFPLDSQPIIELCARHNERRQQRNLAILQKLALNHMPVSEEDVLAELSASGPQNQHTIGRPHIAQAMIKKGYVKTVQEAFQQYLGEGKSCFSPGESVSTQETIDIIHSAGGVAILAHPHLMDNRIILKRLLKMNFDGLEGYYGKLQAAQHKKWVSLGKEKAWLVTGGSDFHGSIKPNIPLGCSWVNEEVFRRLQSIQRH